MTTLRALQCLVALIDAESVTDAAAALHMSQSAVSHQIAGLERELGTRVVERLPRGVRPTAAGRAAVNEARTALKAAARAIETGRQVGGGRAGRLRIACSETMTVWLLAPVLKEWSRRRPEVRLDVTVQIGNPADSLAQRFVADLRRRGLPCSAVADHNREISA
jgi:DNA-binding transcriptional LysR family regulator